MVENNLSKIETGAKHWVARALSVAIVFGVIGGSFWMGYEKGKTKGYSLASKDRATQSYEAQSQTIQNNYITDRSPAFALLSYKRFHLLCVDKINQSTKTEVINVTNSTK